MVITGTLGEAYCTGETDVGDSEGDLGAASCFNIVTNKPSVCCYFSAWPTSQSYCEDKKGRESIHCPEHFGGKVC